MNIVFFVSLGPCVNLQTNSTALDLADVVQFIMCE
jgi:hypothetical protein